MLLFFPETICDISCKLSSKCQNLFSGKGKKKYFKMSAVEHCILGVLTINSGRFWPVLLFHKKPLGADSFLIDLFSEGDKNSFEISPECVYF